MSHAMLSGKQGGWRPPVEDKFFELTMAIIFTDSAKVGPKFVVNRSHIVSFGEGKLDTSIITLSIGKTINVYENYDALKQLMRIEDAERA
jgi:hypothetical protein